MFAADATVLAAAEGRTKPMPALRQIWLAQARRDLLDTQAPASVTAVALRWGFGQPGQFARDDRRAFGEKPSDTLRRRR